VRKDKKNIDRAGKKTSFDIRIDLGMRPRIAEEELNKRRRKEEEEEEEEENISSIGINSINRERILENPNKKLERL
jgi:hypothetical protein